MKKKMNKKGFTLVEIMIVVAIIGLLAAIGIPSFQKARTNAQKKQITNNLRILDAAFEQEGMEQNLDEDKIDELKISAVTNYIRGSYDDLEWPSIVSNQVATSVARGDISIKFEGKTYTCDHPGGTVAE